MFILAGPPSLISGQQTSLIFYQHICLNKPEKQNDVLMCKHIQKQIIYLKSYSTFRLHQLNTFQVEPSGMQSFRPLSHEHSELVFAVFWKAHAIQWAG